jgi:hypothetical protein
LPWAEIWDAFGDIKEHIENKLLTGFAGPEMTRETA